MKKLFLLGAIAATGMTSAHAVDMKAGDWTVNVGGIVNAYYTYVNCDGGSVGGAALAGQALGCGGKDSRTTIGNGLLPSGLITSIKGNQGGVDVGGTIGIMVHAATDSAVAENNNVDVRQAFMTLGTAETGSVKIGRDYGIFGANAILSDMTLLGAGAPVQATQRGRVTLGHIGAGYTYLGTYGQIAYTTPSIAGFKFDIGIMSPVSSVGTAGNTPQLQLQASFAPMEGVKAWVGAKTQKFDGADATLPTVGIVNGVVGVIPGTPAGAEYRMNAVEAGASYAAGPFGVLANVQGGKAIGILTDGDQGDTKGLNYLIQGTFKTSEKMKVGLSYGESKNRDNTFGVANALEKNRNLTLGAYYSLTPAVTLVGEIGQTRSEAFNGASDRMKGASVGGIFFF